jgi:hypothetical protein
MATRFQSSNYDAGISRSSDEAVVYSIILDSTHPKYKDAGDIGAITYRKTSPTDPTATLADNSLPTAYPFDKNFIDLPLVNEMVIIHEEGGNRFYRRKSQDVAGNKNLSSAYDTISKKFAGVTSGKQEYSSKELAEHYNKQQASGTPRSNIDGIASKAYDGYGRYFTPNNIHRLNLNEGDTLIESRFGQSIRFSAFNNPARQFSPTLIIRNKESALTQVSSAASGSINEDINRDGSTIVLSSGEYVLPFIPGTIDEKGSTDFQTKPNSFKPYPEKLKGDQMLLSSGRLILSARNAEMLFYSKGNYGFVSDGQLSIDNKLGMNVSVNDNISFVTNNRDFQVFSGNGSVFLGSKDLEPMVKGQKLVELLKELIDAIGEMQFLTPSGPTAIGPKNNPEFAKISGKLNDILSKLNQTS